jgi:hypothetical protein
MIDRTHAGVRCHTLRLVRTVQGDLPRGTQGTILDDMGRTLVVVSSWCAGTPE